MRAPATNGTTAATTTLRSPNVHVEEVYEIFRQDLVLQKKVYPTRPVLGVKGRGHVNASQVNWERLSSAWDSGSRSVRERLLREFIRTSCDKTGPQLERDFGQTASLFLIRITAWLRLTYLLGQDISLQFDAITIFLTASSGQRFLLEFMEIGGVLTTLEVLGITRIPDVLLLKINKQAALKLLLGIAQQGRKYKEFICESHGIRSVSDCLQRSTNEVTQDLARNLLFQLGSGNPKFLQQVFKSLLAILVSRIASPSSQQLASQALRLLLPSIEHIPAQLVEASLGLLKNIHIQVQYEGYEILRDLLKRKAMQEEIMTELIGMLSVASAEELDELEAKNARQSSIMRRKLRKPSVTSNAIAENEKEFAKDEMELVTASYVQQSYAAKLLGVIAATNEELAEKMLERQVLVPLLVTLANTKYPDSQRYAANTIQFLAQKYPAVQRAIAESLGRLFWDTMESNPDTFYSDFNKEQLKALKMNQVTVHNLQDGGNEFVQNIPENYRPAEDKDNQDSPSPARKATPEQSNTLTAPTASAVPGLTSITPAHSNGDLGSSAAISSVHSSTLSMTLGGLKRSQELTVDEAADVHLDRSKPKADVSTLYHPLEHVTINQSLTTNNDSTTKYDQNDAKFFDEIQNIKDVSQQNRVLAKLGMERKTEVSLELDVSGSKRIAKLVNKNAFRRDIEGLVKEAIGDVGELVGEGDEEQGEGSNHEASEEKPESQGKSRN